MSQPIVKVELTNSEARIIHDAVKMCIIYSDNIDDVENRIAFEQAMFGLYSPLDRIKCGEESSLGLDKYLAEHIHQALVNYRNQCMMQELIPANKIQDIHEKLVKLNDRFVRMLYVDEVFA